MGDPFNDILNAHDPCHGAYTYFLWNYHRNLLSICDQVCVSIFIYYLLALVVFFISVLIIKKRLCFVRPSLGLASLIC